MFKHLAFVSPAVSTLPYTPFVIPNKPPAGFEPVHADRLRATLYQESKRFLEFLNSKIKMDSSDLLWCFRYFSQLQKVAPIPNHRQNSDALAIFCVLVRDVHTDTSATVFSQLMGLARASFPSLPPMWFVQNLGEGGSATVSKYYLGTNPDSEAVAIKKGTRQGGFNLFTCVYEAMSLADQGVPVSIVLDKKNEPLLVMPVMTSPVLNTVDDRVRFAETVLQKVRFYTGQNRLTTDLKPRNIMMYKDTVIFIDMNIPMDYRLIAWTMFKNNNRIPTFSIARPYVAMSMAVETMPDSAPEHTSHDHPVPVWMDGFYKHPSTIRHWLSLKDLYPVLSKDYGKAIESRGVFFEKEAWFAACFTILHQTISDSTLRDDILKHTLHALDTFYIVNQNRLPIDEGMGRVMLCLELHVRPLFGEHSRLFDTLKNAFLADPAMTPLVGRIEDGILLPRIRLAQK